MSLFSSRRATLCGSCCDLADLDLGEVLIKDLIAVGHEVVDIGADSRDCTGLTVYADRVADVARSREPERGVVKRDAGIGEAIGATRRPYIRAASPGGCYAYSMARGYVGAKAPCVGARVVGPGLAVEPPGACPAETGEGGARNVRLGMMRGGYEGGRP